ncbi:MAG: helicase HerA-like domain-containing protein [Candidatus Jordarchaeales archaeon]
MGERAFELGTIICEGQTPNHLAFSFQVARDVEVKVGEYVEVPLGLSVMVGRVYSIHTYNEYFSSPEFLQFHLEDGVPVQARFPTRIGRWRVARVRVVGVLRGDRLLPPEVPPEPGDTVYRAKPELLESFLKFRPDGVFLGVMRGNNDVKVFLNPELLLPYHVAVLGATGSGKSYAVGVIVEELLEKGMPVVVVDPHGEYRFFSQRNDNPEEVERARRMGVTPRGFPTMVYSLGEDGDRKLSISIDDLNPYALAEVCDLSDAQSDLLYLAFRKLGGGGYGLDELVGAVKAAAREWGFQKNTLTAVLRKIQALNEFVFFGKSISVGDLVKPGHLSVLDLSGGVDEEIRRTVVGVVLERMFNARRRGKIPPVVVVVEESHRFAPQGVRSYCGSVLRRIAREGRKFGVTLCLTSQRVAGLDKDVLTQCGTKIILRIEGAYDIEYLKPILDYASADEAERIPLLPTGTAMVTGMATRTPILVDVRPRKTKHGGGHQAFWR